MLLLMKRKILLCIIFQGNRECLFWQIESRLIKVAHKWLNWLMVGFERFGSRC